MNNHITHSEYILDLQEVNKEFPGVHALDHVSFQVKAGDVHGIIGENGAGKSTLMKILIGIHCATSGQVIFDGDNVSFRHPAEALGAGIAMVHQELMPVKELTVAQSIFLGKELTAKGIGFIQDKVMRQQTQTLFQELSIDLNPGVKVGTLSTANIQLVEIAKAISYDAKLIIMDEPTSSLTENEVEKLFTMIKMLKERGVTVLYISHKMDEIMQITDRVTVLRDGKFIQTLATAETTIDQLINLMVGREINELFPKLEVAIGDVVLEAKGLTRKGVFENISLQVRQGEILGLSGLVGAGRSEVMRALFGLDPLDSGEIWIDGKKVEIRSPRDAICHGIIFLTEERKRDGLFLCHSVRNNLVIANIKVYMGRFKLNFKKMCKDCQEQIDRLSIKTPSQDQIISNLSGGNQQKVLLSKWLLTQPRILIMDEPTRGIDVGAKAEIHAQMSQLAQNGCAIIMVSSELPEIIGMSDRILVMHEGKKTGEVLRSKATQDGIMHLAFGLTDRAQING